MYCAHAYHRQQLIDSIYSLIPILNCRTLEYGRNHVDTRQSNDFECEPLQPPRAINIFLGSLWLVHSANRFLGFERFANIERSNSLCTNNVIKYLCLFNLEFYSFVTSSPVTIPCDKRNKVWIACTDQN